MTLRRGLYVLTDSALIGGSLEEAVSLAILGGATMVQYRDKTGGPRERLEQVQALLPVCRRAGVPLIVNDDVTLAFEARADGVHLGREDGPLEEARERLGRASIIGVSCYNDLERAKRLAAQGADYVAFGSFFPSATKPQAVRAELSLLTEAKHLLPVPIVAIGGITAENGAQLIATGADMLAVVSGVFGTTDIRAAAGSYADLFK